MRKLLWLLGAMITSISLGVGFIQPEEKVFTPASYYTGKSLEENPDWRGLYLSTIGGGSFSSSQVSDKSVKRLDGDETTYVPKTPSRFYWFWSFKKDTVKDVTAPNGGQYKDVMIRVDGDEEDQSLVKALEGDLLDKKDKITFRVAKGTKLIAPANSYLVPTSQNSDGAYPSENKTRGKYMQVIVKKDKVAYRITYEDMLMWWSDMNKTAPDDYKEGDKAQPLYYHSLAFSENDIFDSGAIVGQAGNTGMLPDKRSEDTAYVTLSIEECEVKDGVVTEVWFPISIKQFFNSGGV